MSRPMLWSAPATAARNWTVMNDRSTAQRLLIVDDDQMIGALVARIANRAGYQTLQVATSDDFLERVRAWGPTHIIVDLQMPVVDGLELLSQLASDQSTARIILISGAGERVLDAARQVGLARGLDVAAALAKPFTPTELEGVLRENRLGEPWLTAAGIQAAIDRHEFFLLYQPKVSLKTGTITSVEALVRWRHPERGLVSPLEFIPFAESSVCIDRMTDWVLEAACAQLKAWDAMGCVLQMAVNLSARSLHDSRIADRFETHCRAAGVDTARLSLELTETSSIRDGVLLTDVLTRLRVKGFGLSIDDFGTGHSSLALLQRQPFTEVKIDRMFVAGSTTSTSSHAIVRVVADLAHALGMRAVAEGVETAEVLRVVRALGCEEAQGTYISKPVSGDEVLAAVRGQATSEWHRAGAPWPATA